MTPKERAAALVEAQGDELSRYQRMFLAQDIEAAIVEAIRDAIEEVATKLERNLHTSAAAIVRQMKVKTQ